MQSKLEHAASDLKEKFSVVNRLGKGRALLLLLGFGDESSAESPSNHFTELKLIYTIHFLPNLQPHLLHP